MYGAAGVILGPVLTFSRSAIACPCPPYIILAMPGKKPLWLPLVIGLEITLVTLYAITVLINAGEPSPLLDVNGSEPYPPGCKQPNYFSSAHCHSGWSSLIAIQKSHLLEICWLSLAYSSYLPPWMNCSNSTSSFNNLNCGKPFISL
ncbi:MAG: hypothetical protein AAF171_04010 [Cyanobacteria bacterium P01_A01_bin.116]